MKYKRSINCSKPKGFSQKNYCKRQNRGGEYKESLEKSLAENRNRTGLKFGYPDGYYRFQYPPAYSMPSSATAALDLEIEKLAPMGTESPNGMPKVIKNPEGMTHFPENSFREWLKLNK